MRATLLFAIKGLKSSMNNTIGFGLLACFTALLGYAYISPDFVLDPKFYLQAIVSGLGGAGILLVEHFQRILGWFRRSEQDVSPHCFAYSEKDFQALEYLKNRLKETESKRGLEILVELNTILFSLDMNDSSEDVEAGEGDEQ